MPESTSVCTLEPGRQPAPMHPSVQVNANKYDSDLPHAQDERNLNLAFNEQTTQPGTPIGC